MEHWWNDTDMVKPTYTGVHSVPVALFPPQIPQRMAWD